MNKPNPVVEKTDLDQAVAAWRELLGEAYVRLEEAELRAAETSTYPTEPKVLAIIEPASTEEVAGAMRIATRFGVPVYPVSGGKNWGYGSRVPGADAVLMELGRMKRIVELDVDLGYVTVEPGVSFDQLFDYILERAPHLEVAVTGGPGNGSPIGNRLERGQSGNWQPIPEVRDLQVVLPTGEVIHTGMSRFDGVREPSLQPFAPGPGVTSLFEQSNLGVVTRATFLLLRRAAATERFLISVREHDDVGPLVDVIRDLILDGIGGPIITLSNDYRELSRRMPQFPWDLAPDGAPVPLDVQGRRPPAWIAVVNVPGASEAIARETGKLVRQRLKPVVDTLIAIRPWHEKVAKALLPLSRRLELFEGEVEFVAEIDEPYRCGSSVYVGYWHKRTPVPSDPDHDRDRCGVMWFCPTAPARPDAVIELSHLLRRIALKHGFEPNMRARFWEGRSVVFFLSLLWDRDVEGGDERALACYEELYKEAAAAGYVPYRLRSTGMDCLPPMTDDSAALFQRLKTALDPADVLSPGRYDYRARWSAEEHDDE